MKTIFSKEKRVDDAIRVNWKRSVRIVFEQCFGLDEIVKAIKGFCVNSDWVVVQCYNTPEIFSNRNDAIKFYGECARACEGCEAERYMNIYWSLMDGDKVCKDFNY